MKQIITCILSALVLMGAQASYGAPDKTQLAVWANEAIIATYTFDYKNFIKEQKTIAKYFTSTGWINYSKALHDSKLPELIEKNAYFVSAVATLPPVITVLDDTHWQAVMPILVVYENPQYKQKQSLKVTMRFSESDSDNGIRGLNVDGIQSVVTEPPCDCTP
jgi:hypothetical protein